MTALSTLEIGLKTKLPVTELMNGSMEEGTKEVGSIIACMAEDATAGQMEENMMVSIIWIKKKEKEYLFG